MEQDAKQSKKMRNLLEDKLSTTVAQLKSAQKDLNEEKKRKDFHQLDKESYLKQIRKLQDEKSLLQNDKLSLKFKQQDTLDCTVPASCLDTYKADLEIARTEINFKNNLLMTKETTIKNLNQTFKE